MRVPESRLDTLARGIASGALSRREVLRVGGAALVGAAAISPADALARATRHCPHGHAHCAGKCCPPGEVCLPPKHKGGKHTCGCPNHRHRCGSKCVELNSDPHNCGGCGHACGAGQSCAAGKCTCPAGMTACADGCVKTASDRANCGACGHACASGQLCDAGQCVSQCPSGKTECNGGCVDTTSDASNCGTCGHSCGANATCVNSQCACPNGTTNCNGACVDTNSDLSNCGACGTKCSSFFATSSCQNGTCHIDSCSPFWADCDGDPLTGCECQCATMNCVGACNGKMCAA